MWCDEVHVFGVSWLIEVAVKDLEITHRLFMLSITASNWTHWVYRTNGFATGRSLSLVYWWRASMNACVCLPVGESCLAVLIIIIISTQPSSSLFVSESSDCSEFFWVFRLFWVFRVSEPESHSYSIAIGAQRLAMCSASGNIHWLCNNFSWILTPDSVCRSQLRQQHYVLSIMAFHMPLSEQLRLAVK